MDAPFRVGLLGRLLLALVVVVAGCGQSVAPSSVSPTRSSGVAATAATAPTSVGSVPRSSVASVASVAPGRTAPASGATTGFAPTGQTEIAKVVRVVDGDTIVVDRGRGQEHLRYIGMDTPESVKPGTPIEWLAKEASQANVGLVGGKTVVLETEVSDTDQYGRLLRDVWLHVGANWQLVDLVLVQQGYARAARYPPDVKYAARYTAAEATARSQRLGIWGPGPLAFVQPVDGSTVAVARIMVTGTARPGLRIVEDIPNALDRSAIVAADGTWSLVADLRRGLNNLKFRIGDEKATTRTLQVTYRP